MPERRNFRVQMKHEVGFQIDITYTDTTQMEALDRMFVEARKMANKPFTAGSVKAHETAYGVNVAGKSM